MGQEDQVVSGVGRFLQCKPENTAELSVSGHNKSLLVYEILVFAVNFATLLQGWRPLRTVMLASWDAEEISLIGSTETTELLREELNHRAVIYINQDCPIKGNATFNGRTDQLLADALRASAAEVSFDPPGNMSLLDYWRELQGKPPGDLPETVPPLGSTDHVPFQYKLGVPSMYPEFRPAYPMFEAPSYHTEYDSVDMAIKFTDPPSATGELLPLHRLLAKLNVNLLLRFSSSPVLPISVSTLASSLNRSWVEFEHFVCSLLPHIRTHGIKLDVRWSGTTKDEGDLNGRLGFTPYQVSKNTMGKAIGWRQNAYDSKMDMAEASVEVRKSARWGLIVALNLAPLATRARSGPGFDVFVHARPDELFPQGAFVRLESQGGRVHEKFGTQLDASRGGSTNGR
ncbi:unnamed protein product [Dibothriocephalus latus]|uniref:Peptidase M28 domain-containing protein n=1 Tax=Dibothriocephalus latus TaxID=60516 RepID=A0A3P6V9M5_DIBLA|nr:unnamed protein product [Dibothriocephalus latus]